MSLDRDPQGFPPFLVEPGDTAGMVALKCYTLALSYWQDVARGGMTVQQAQQKLLPLGLAIDAHTRLMAPIRARHPLAPGVDVDGLTCGDEAELMAVVNQFGGPAPW